MKPSPRRAALLPTDRAKLDPVAQSGRQAEQRIEGRGVRTATPSPHFDGANRMVASRFVRDSTSAAGSGSRASATYLGAGVCRRRSGCLRRRAFPPSAPAVLGHVRGRWLGPGVSWSCASAVLGCVASLHDHPFSFAPIETASSRVEVDPIHPIYPKIQPSALLTASSSGTRDPGIPEPRPACPAAQPPLRSGPLHSRRNRSHRGSRAAMPARARRPTARPRRG